MQNKCARYWPELHTVKQYGTVIVENISETNYGPAQLLNHSSRSHRAVPTPTSVDDDCCYRLRVLRITTEDRRTWDIFHWQYLAWGDHGKSICREKRNVQFSML